jgi:hypothetical protein
VKVGGRPKKNSKKFYSARSEMHCGCTSKNGD